MIRIGGTFPVECHLQESESDYCKVTNNKSESYHIKPSGENVISKKVKVITFRGECHLRPELDRLHFGRQVQSKIRADEIISWAGIREKILAQIFTQKVKTNLKER